MLGKRVVCNVRSACENRTVRGVVVSQCNNPNVYVLKLDHAVDFLNGKRYTYPKNSTILVTETEIMR